MPEGLRLSRRRWLRRPNSYGCSAARAGGAKSDGGATGTALVSSASVLFPTGPHARWGPGTEYYIRSYYYYFHYFHYYY